VQQRKRPGGFLGKALDRLEETVGFAVVDSDYLRVTEAVSREAMILANDLEEIGYVSMNFLAGRPQEPTAVTRRRWAQQARVVWLADPVAGAAVEMLNEFTFGRGVARPRFKDEEAQEVVDEAWDDPQNQRVLTSFLAQVKLGNSLSVQSNVFLQMFDDGDDGKVKLSFLNHDAVNQAMTDPENRQRVLFYVAAKSKQGWDFDTNAPKPVQAEPKVYYYEAWAGLEEALRERGIDEETVTEILERYRSAGEKQSDEDGPPETPQPRPGEPYKVDQADDLTLPPPNRLGAGKVYHLTDGNLDMEMIFGVPRMRRTMRWYSALNDFMKARVDMMQAAAAFIMNKKVTGSPAALEKMAGKAMRAGSELAGVMDEAISPDGVKQGPRPASMLSTTGGVAFEPFNLKSGAGDAQTDGQMLRSQVSAGDRWPQHYIGDASTANLATATAIELPVLKHVEARQELIEQVFRWFIDRVIERAVDAKRLDPNKPTPAVEDTDVPKLLRTDMEDAEDPLAQEGGLVETREMLWRINGADEWRETKIVARPDGSVEYLLQAPVSEAHEDKGDDETETGRDLSYEFGMPSPLRRMMADLVAAAVQTAQMADPNGLNVELTRVLLTLVLAEGFEMQDASDVVDRIFPKGYDPMAALQAAQGGGGPGQPPGRTAGQGGAQTNFFGPDATDLPADPSNAYGARSRSQNPEDVQGAQEGVWLPLAEADDDWEVPPLVAVGRAGQPVLIPGRTRGGMREGRVPMRVNGRVTSAAREFDSDVRGVAMDALAALDMDRVSTNGHKEER
jgi:hypothetical protein